MDSKVINKVINKNIWSFLKEQGFIMFTPRSAWRFNQDTIEIIDFQSFNSCLAEVLGCTTYSFTVNLAIYFTKIPDKFPNITIKEKTDFCYLKSLDAILESV